MDRKGKRGRRSDKMTWGFLGGGGGVEHKGMEWSGRGRYGAKRKEEDDKKKR